MKLKNYKKGFLSLELILVIIVVGFIGTKIFLKNAGTENDIKATIVKDDITAIFEAVVKAKASATISGNTYDFNMEDIKPFLPSSMSLDESTGDTSYVTSISPEIGNGIKYYWLKADTDGTIGKLFIDAEDFVTAKNMSSEKISLFETYASDEIKMRANSATVAHNVTAIGAVGANFAESTASDKDGIIGFGNISF